MMFNQTLTSELLEGQEIDMAMKKFGQLVRTVEERLTGMKTVAQELRDILDAEQRLKSTDESMSVPFHQHNIAGLVSATQGGGNVWHWWAVSYSLVAYPDSSVAIDHESHSRQSPIPARSRKANSVLALLTFGQSFRLISLLYHTSTCSFSTWPPCITCGSDCSPANLI